MNPVLQVILNNEVMINYPHNTRLPGKQREFLDIMDIEMDEGINLEGKSIDTPDYQQRTHYVAMKLIQALMSNNQGMIKATCAYLVNRQPALHIISATEEDEEMTLELIYE